MVVQNFHWKYNQLSAVGQAGGCEAVPSSSCFTTAGRTSSGRRPWRLNLPQTSSPYCHTPRVAKPIYSLDSFTHPALSPGKLLCPHPILNSVFANLFAQGGKFGGKGGMGGWFDLGPLAATPHPPCLRPVGPPNFLCHRQKRKSPLV